jgi:anti-anti-sigma factor
MQIHESKQGDTLVLALQGHLDADSAWAIEKRFENAMKRGDLQIVVNCAALDYINSSGLKTILAAHNQLREQGGRLVVAGLIPAVATIFEMVGFTRILTIYPDLDKALSILEADGTKA